MNIPFSLAISSTTPYGLLWNPDATVVANSAANTVLSNLTALQITALGFGTLPQRCVLEGYCVVSDTAGATVSFGYWDTSVPGYVELLPVQATINAGGGVNRTIMDTGQLFHFSAVRIPCLKFTAVSGSAILTGDVDVRPLQNPVDTVVTGMIPAPGGDILDEADGFILDELGLHINPG